MSKELKAFETIRKALEIAYPLMYEEENEMPEYIKIIETALKNYEEFINTPVMFCRSTQGSKQALIDMICKNHKEVKITCLEDEKKVKALEIISQNFKLVNNCLHAKNKYAESGWVFVKEIEDDEELEAWKEVLL